MKFHLETKSIIRQDGLEEKNFLLFYNNRSFEVSLLNYKLEFKSKVTRDRDFYKYFKKHFEVEEWHRKTAKIRKK